MIKVDQIGQMPMNLFQLKKAPEEEKYNSRVFEDFFHAAVDMYHKTNIIEEDLNKRQIDFATGKNEDMAALMIAQEKAYLSFQFTVQVTNKALDAYKEIMRMQI